MKRVGAFIKGLIKQEIWLGVMGLIQVLAAVIAFLIRVKLDPEFFRRLADASVVVQDETNQADMLMSTLEPMMSTLMNLIGDIEIISVFFFIGFYLISRRLKNKDNNYGFAKVNTYEIITYIWVGLLINLIGEVILSFIPDSFMSSSGYTELTTFTGNPILLAIGVGMCAPLIEEITFRYFMYNSMKKVNIKVAIITTSIWFGLAHGNIVQSTYAFLFALLFIYVNNKRQSLVPSLTLHISINLSSVITQDHGTVWLALITLIATVPAIIVIYKNKESMREIYGRAGQPREQAISN